MANQKKILIIEDDEGIREALQLILSDHYDIILTEDGQQGMECLYKENSIQCVLLDIKLPQINGLDILKTIKEKRPECKTIIVTGYKSVETVSQAAKIGADGYITKPFDASDILETVKKFM
ncbi:MAG: response regulator [Candidatus Omnitrophica bacterium]|nr:response regulator [Candidatus Omnitrophota bacterium]